MKMRMILTLLMLAGWAGIQAQPRQEFCAQRATTLLKFLKDSAGINTVQESRIRSILDSNCLCLQAVMKQYNGNKEQARPEMERIRREGMEQVRSVLTEEQRGYLRARRKGARGNSGMHPGP